MIDFHYAPTPNGWKVAIMLEECGLDYRTLYIDLFKGEQLTRDFLAISPNAKMPAILDHAATPAIPVFESGAILWYLAEKTGRFLSDDRLLRKETMEWLFWQTGNQGPMAGQLAHFRLYGPKSGQDYALARYRGEYERSLAVLERRLRGRDFIVGDYSIADMLSFPWAFVARNFDVSLDRFPEVKRWRETIKARPAVRRAIDLMKDIQNDKGEHNATNNATLYNQDAAHLLDID
jgi:GSH-dependent disulfide-bond oxidoreductase